MYLHPTYIVTPGREPLGVTNAWMWAREPKPADGQRPGVLESLRSRVRHQPRQVLDSIESSFQIATTAGQTRLHELHLPSLLR